MVQCGVNLPGAAFAAKSHETLRLDSLVYQVKETCFLERIVSSRKRVIETTHFQKRCLSLGYNSKSEIVQQRVNLVKSDLR